MIALLDVNVLLALAWPTHIHHYTARSWFTEQMERGWTWATCPLTEAGFVRLSCNHSAMGYTVTPREAIETLGNLRRMGAHSFWPLDLSMLDLPGGIVSRVQGHRQITDAVLLAAAMRRNGQLATFDGRLASLAADEARPFLHVIPA